MTTKEVMSRASALLNANGWPRMSRRKRLFYWFIQQNKTTWYIAYMLLNIDQPRRARRYFKAHHPWVFCERIPR